MTTSDRKFLVIMAGLVGPGAIVCFFGLRYDERLSRIEVLERAPSAPPLEELKQGLREVAVTEPITETFMVSSEGTRAFAFARPGFPIASYGEDPEEQASMGRDST